MCIIRWSVVKLANNNSPGLPTSTTRTTPYTHRHWAEPSLSILFLVYLERLVGVVPGSLSVVKVLVIKYTHWLHM